MAYELLTGADLEARKAKLASVGVTFRAYRCNDNRVRYGYTRPHRDKDGSAGRPHTEQGFNSESELVAFLWDMLTRVYAPRWPELTA